MVSAASSIIQLFTSHWVSAVLSSAVELEVFEYLRGVTTLTELHARTGVPVRSLQALLDGRFNVSFADIQKIAVPCLRHRLLLNFEGEAENLSTDAVIEDMLKQTPTVTEKVA